MQQDHTIRRIPSADWLLHRFARFDRRANNVAAIGRERQVLTALMYRLSRAGDDGRVWIASVLVLARRRDRPASWAVRALLVLGVESIAVNWGLKNLFRRSRPVSCVDHGARLRPPTDTSFPSGHAASGTTMAVLLSDGSGSHAWWLLAAGIGWSRVHLGVHHASDVVAGWAVGAGFGFAARAWVRADRCPTDPNHRVSHTGRLVHDLEEFHR